MKKLLLGVIAAFIGLALLIDNSLVKPASRRVASTHDSTPKSSTQDIDFSELSATEFARAFKYQLISSSHIEQDSENTGIAFGSFYILGSNKQKNFVCTKFFSIELIFEAEGIAVSGAIPQMIVQGPCLTSADTTSIEALPIFYKKILSSAVSQKSFQESLKDSNETVSIQFKDVVEQWPLDWNLVSVKLSTSETDEILAVNGYEIIAILGAPLSIHWSP